ncbi:hypothetical protein PoB_003377800 [Plakobranchus ocellatus]|uniref:Uncharacterized protein n=1 Tax=Plakobranchus ocellatus TaxID=259542 RepID=A0AAV4AL47_9GAST|nr:hypothetical protein PoB_003377800 [Plakobranchus ocellatus]
MHSLAATASAKELLARTFIKSVFLILVCSLRHVTSSDEDSRPTVHLVAMESTGVQDGGSTYYVRYLQPLLEIALEDARERFGKYLDIRFKHIETLCGPSEIGALAAEEYYKHKVDAFFGPGKYLNLKQFTV